jgi:hypothetical protein
VTQQPRFIGFEHLDRQEEAACVIAVSVLDAVEAEACGGSKGAYENIIRICERARQPCPCEIAWEESAHEDLKWLVYQSSSEITGYPDQLARNMKSPAPARIA